jgi:hypothetical protein
MAQGKKGQLYQFMIPIVDATDFASVESAVTASDFNSGATVKFYGCDHGVSTATTSGTVSKAASLVRSGVFRITLKTTENNYDAMLVRINKTGIAEQIVTWENTTNDDSDLMSALTVIQSMASDAASAAQQGASRALINQSRISDVQSYLVAMSDSLSDMHSDIRSYLVGLSATLSDVHSAVSDAHSDLASKIAGITASVSASDISDIASAVQAILASDVSDLLSRTTQINSRVLLNQSRISDVQSYLVALSDQLSDAHSDLKSALGDISVTITASDISDIASAVVAALPITSTVSDIYSLLSDLNSNFHSRIPKEPAARSQLSDLASDIYSSVSDVMSVVSDAHSAATAAASRALLNQSRISDVYSLLSDLESNFGSRVPKAVATNSQLSDLMSDAVSDLRSFIGAGVPLDASTLSDLRSAITAAEFDASDISDIASRVYAVLVSDLSDIQSAATAGASRALLNQSLISDVYSAIVAGVEIGASSLSDLRSAIAATELDASDLSDIASAVWAKAGADPTAVPGVTAGMGAKLDWLTALGRNKITQTSAVQSLRNDADAADIASAAVSDDGTTFTRGEWA